MKLDLAAISRQERRARRWAKVLEVFQALGGEDNVAEFRKIGISGARGDDASTYTVTSAGTLVTFQLLYLKDQLGLVVCTTPHPMIEDRKLPVFSFAINADGETDIEHPHGGPTTFELSSPVIASMALEEACRQRVEAVRDGA